MNYTVEITFEGMTTDEITGLTKAQAIKTAKIKAAESGEEYQVFVSFFRPSDGQRGYLNRDGNHEITGTAW